MSKFSNAVLRSARKSKANVGSVEFLMTIKDEFGNTKFVELCIPQATLDQLSQQSQTKTSESLMMTQRFALPLDMMKASE